ncbi:LOG family protein [Pseudoclavibacter sp. CFCC 14310]|uniref:LOG family protein n=1 Tax=Pseudoclavibacter sp. CFCC 14310 TaxID=2615180 RepID=UPI00130116D8|nr:LOG family protein [Pseudoclavibacter sp. CFCC 14310]KAB1645585.1 LOG family protein [Pseudoclavibacter sp. CFCC 14310]KAB1645956.1 LOG family protein [Pseudoclavibacter sp. CFCC 14310]
MSTQSISHSPDPASVDLPSTPERQLGQVRELIEECGITDDADLVERIVIEGLGLGEDGADRLNLKIASSAISEMRQAFQLFARFDGRPKVTVFGSARTKPDDVVYQMARDVAERLAAMNWLVVTGAGPGIMQAATEGAGPESSIGVAIRLPFESPNPTFTDETNLVSMKYFFTRKLMLVKESQGFVCIPGGFGTLDELFELLTLQQTGKSVPTPIVLLDRPAEGVPTEAVSAHASRARNRAGYDPAADEAPPRPIGGFWSGLRRFVDDQLIPSGVVSPDDLDRVMITDSVDEAVHEIAHFWNNYDSLRWVGSRLILRLRNAPTDDEIADLNRRFSYLTPDAAICRTEPLRPETRDHDKVDLPRLMLTPDSRQIGHLFQLIRAINDLPSAPRE